MGSGNATGSIYNTLISALEASKIEKVAAGYPEEMREALIWLAAFTVKECDHKAAVLESRVKELGFSATGSTFIKIFKGRWNTDSKNQPLENPVMAVKNFLQIVEKLRSDDKLKQLAGKVPFVMTGTAKRIFHYIDARRSPDRINRFGFIVGPTGAQKTATFKQYQLENNHGMTVWLEAPETPSMAQFITDLAYCYNVGIWTDTRTKRLKIMESVNHKKTIIVDNVQRLYRVKDGGNQSIFGYLQKLQDDTGCTVILSATEEFYNTFTEGQNRGYFEQFVGRCGGSKQFLKLDKYTPREDVLEIAKAFKMQEASRHVKYMEDICRESGRVRVLFGALQDARQLADDAGEPLTIRHLKAIRDEEDENQEAA